MPTSRIKRETELKPKEQRAIAARIRDRMNELGWSVVDVFGDKDKPGRSSISRTAWYSYAADDTPNWRPIPMEALRELEQVLYLPAGELLKMAGWLPAGVEDFARSPGAVLIAIELDPTLKPGEREALLAIARQFVTKTGRRPKASPTVT